jgi:FkbM family methyltransferase
VCFALNVPAAIADMRNAGDMKNGRYTLHRFALGALEGFVQMSVDPADTGGTHIKAVVDDGNIEMRTLDSYELPQLDFLKIDCEGYEHHVVAGGRETIARCKPVVIVEQKPHKLAANYGVKGKPAVDFILGLNLGYVLRREMGGDFILSVD